MRDPYEVLGVSPDATEEEINKAHQEMVQKYHPENHPDNPLAHLAREKIEEANKAYDEIIRLRQNSSTSNEGGSKHLDIRRLINNNRITEAEELLEGVPFQDRDAEWYFLKGTIQHSRGWLDDAYENFNKAVQMNPQNAEYRATLSQLQWQRQTGQPQAGYPQAGYPQTPTSMSSCGVCDMCMTAYCLSTWCRCCCR